MKMSYQRVVSYKDQSTAKIDTQRFYTEKEIDINGLDPLAKQRLMIDAAKELHLASAIMRKEMTIEQGDER